MQMGEALRREGLDEHTVAERYAGVVSRLKKDPGDIASGDKLLVEILKECSRQMEATQPAGESSIQVKLVHNVERPARSHLAEAARTGEIALAGCGRARLDAWLQHPEQAPAANGGGEPPHSTRLGATRLLW